MRTDRDAGTIQQERIFEALLGKNVLTQSRQENDVKGHARSFGYGRNKYLSIAAVGRLASEESQAFGKRFPNFVQRDRSDAPHWTQFHQDGENHLRLPERDARKLLQAIKPFVPG